MSSKDIDDLKKAAGEYATEALEARKKFLELRLRQDPEVRQVFIKAVDRIASELKSTKVSLSRAKEMKRFLDQVQQETGIVNSELTDKITQYHLAGAEAGSWMNRAVTVKLFKKADLPDVSLTKIDQSFVRINKQAVEAVQNRVIKGLNLSQRIWNTSNHFGSEIGDILSTAAATGQDAVTTAQLLQRYVKTDAMTLARDYPEIAKRMPNLPKNLSYEALRLARTEGTATLGEATVRSAKASPSAIGIQYCLSSQHHIHDICDMLASEDEAGLGPGVYPVDDPPVYPAHPNTMSFLVVKHATPEDFVKRLKNWEQNPNSDQSLEKWYNNLSQNGNTTNEKPAPEPSNRKTSNLTPEQKKLYINVRDLSRPVKTALTQSWDDAQQFGLTHNREIIYKLNSKTGERMFALEGTAHEVTFTQELTDFLTTAEPESLLSVHNHPSSSCFSGNDLAVMVNYPSIQYLSVIGHDGTRYLLKVGKGKRPKPADVYNRWNALRLKYYDYYYNLVMDGKITPFEASKAHSHQVMTDLAKEYGWDYQRYLPGGNKNG